MDELTAFVRARLNEEQALLDEDEAYEGLRFNDLDDMSEKVIRTFADEGRLQREVAAKRRIVDDYRITAGACQRVTGAEIDTVGYRTMCAGRDALKSCVIQLAAVWSDHPDYRAEWR